MALARVSARVSGWRWGGWHCAWFSERQRTTVFWNLPCVFSAELSTAASWTQPTWVTERTMEWQRIHQTVRVQRLAPWHVAWRMACHWACILLFSWEESSIAFSSLSLPSFDLLKVAGFRWDQRRKFNHCLHSEFSLLLLCTATLGAHIFASIVLMFSVVFCALKHVLGHVCDT